MLNLHRSVRLNLAFQSSARVATYLPTCCLHPSRRRFCSKKEEKNHIERQERGECKEWYGTIRTLVFGLLTRWPAESRYRIGECPSTCRRCTHMVGDDYENKAHRDLDQDTIENQNQISKTSSIVFDHCPSAQWQTLSTELYPLS